MGEWQPNLIPHKNVNCRVNSSFTETATFAAKSKSILGAHHVFWVLVTLPTCSPSRAELIVVDAWCIGPYIKRIIKWSYMRADHFSPSITGQLPWRLLVSIVALTCKLKKSSASPFFGFTAMRIALVDVKWACWYWSKPSLGLNEKKRVNCHYW
jgi:hypothetical protein